MVDNYVQYTFEDDTPKELSTKAKVILTIIFVILVVLVGFLGYKLKTYKLNKEFSESYEEYDPNFELENYETEKSGWQVITAEKIEPYKETE